MEEYKEYIGDGVYASIENGMIKLTTEDGPFVSNTIYLELEIFYLLNQYVKKLNIIAK